MLDWFLETAAFMPHGYCLLWRPDLVALHAGSDALTAIAYLTIPLAMAVVIRKRKDLSLGPAPVLFISFILLCGLNHVFSLLTLAYPLYGLQGLVKLAMAGVSVATAILIWPLIPKILALPSVSDLGEKNARLEAALREKQHLVDELSQAREELALSQSRLWAAIDAIPDGFVIFDANDRIVAANEAFTSFFKPIGAHLGGDATFDDYLRAGAEQGAWDLQGEPVEDWIERQLEARLRDEHSEILVRRADGRWMQRTERRMDSGEWVGLHVDVTEHKQRELELRRANDQAQATTRALEAAKAQSDHELMHDPLTGLANRRGLDALMRRRARAGARESQSGDGGVALIHIDLDGFRQVNNTYGQVIGDQILIEIARMLRETVAEYDAPARIGGDRFAVIAPYGGDIARLTCLIETLMARIAEPIRIERHSCSIAASIGVAVSNTANIDASTLLADADAALFRAKSLGGGRYEFYSEELRQEQTLLRRTGDEILAGLEAGAFIAYYQPQICGRTLKVRGAEALARWRHPERGVLAPYAFLDTAEQMSLTPAIDRAVLAQASADLQAWDAAGLSPIHMSVNVSARRLGDPSLPEAVDALALPRGRFSFEILETTFLDEVDDTVRRNIERLKEMGVDIEIDDFGSGHASIIGLTRLKPRRLRIDRRLVAPAAECDHARDLLRSIFEIGRSFDMEIVAEGVETPEHVSAMQALGADVLQGYAFARPMPAEEFAEYLARSALRDAG